MEHFKFNIFSFVIAFCLGIAYLYIKKPEERSIIKYPTPYNSDKLIYKGFSGDCYKYKKEELKCSKQYLQQPIM